MRKISFEVRILNFVTPKKYVNNWIYVTLEQGFHIEQVASENQLKFVIIFKCIPFAAESYNLKNSRANSEFY